MRHPNRLFMAAEQAQRQSEIQTERRRGAMLFDAFAECGDRLFTLTSENEGRRTSVGNHDVALLIEVGLSLGFLFRQANHGRLAPSALALPVFTFYRS